MSSWFALHGDDVGMTSSCSHRIHITLMTSSHSGCDIIAADDPVTCAAYAKENDLLALEE